MQQQQLPLGGVGVLFNWGHLTQSQQAIIQKIMERNFRMFGIRSQVNGGLPNNAVFRKDVESIQESQEYQKAPVNSKERKEMLAEVLIEYV